MAESGIKSFIKQWATQQVWLEATFAYYLAVMLLIVLTAILLHLVLHRGVLKRIQQSPAAEGQLWQQAIQRHQLFRRVAYTAQGFVLHLQAHIWLDAQSDTLWLLSGLTELWMLLFGVLSAFSLLDTLEAMIQQTGLGRTAPVRGIFQSIKLVGSLLALIIALSMLSGKSPVLLLSGLGAMTAVLILVFKDPILGFVAGIQISANKMLQIGDWLEMPKYGADGAVIEMNLTTVKVRNWDNTITNIPAYALISDSFKNWRGMSESGGRRIKRAIFLDATSIRFLTDADIERLRHSKLLQGYFAAKLPEIAAANRQLTTQSVLDHRCLTNIGTLRAYLTFYLQQHPAIHAEMTQIVRQLAPTPHGVPLEIYAFCSNTAWAYYEAVQADIFDHLYAVLTEFDLRMYQQPTGYDLRALVEQVRSGQISAAD